MRLRLFDLFQHAAHAVQEPRIFPVRGSALLLQHDIVEVVARVQQLIDLPAAGVVRVRVAFEVPAGACDRIRLHRKPEVFGNAVEQAGHAAAELHHAVTVGKAVADEQHLQLFIHHRLVAVLAHILPVSAVVCGGEVLAVVDDVATALVRLPESVVGRDLLLAVGVKLRRLRRELYIAVEHKNFQLVFGKVFARAGNGGGQDHIVRVADPVKGVRADVFHPVRHGDRGYVRRPVVPRRLAFRKVLHPAAAANAQFEAAVRLDRLRRHRGRRVRRNIPSAAAAGR